MIIPYSSVNWEALFKIRFDVLSVGTQNLDIIARTNSPDLELNFKIDFSRSPDKYMDASWTRPEKYHGVFGFSACLLNGRLKAINIFLNNGYFFI